ncbi:MAG TPA: hypothetical protein VGQ34_05505 [Sphingomicrobium sp.]|jgi:hypothetical protein|nr:hypothetical protein [Sphingomicrobium sp.]
MDESAERTETAEPKCNLQWIGASIAPWAAWVRGMSIALIEGSNGRKMNINKR